MLDVAEKPRLIARINSEFPYVGLHEIASIDSSRRITLPSKLHQRFEERKKLLESDSFIGRKMNIGGYKFVGLWDYVPDISSQARFHRITISSSGQKLYIPTGINLADRGLVILGMGELIEIWYEHDFVRYVQTQMGLRANNAS